MSGSEPAEVWEQLPDEAAWASPDGTAAYPMADRPPSDSPYQYSPEELQGTLRPERRRLSRRVLWSAAAVVAAGALATAGVLVVKGQRHGDSVVAAVACAPAKLSSCLIHAPAGAVPLSDAPTWDQAVSPSLDAYASSITGDIKSMTSDTSTEVAGDGETALAHVDWNAVDGDDVDLVLLEFNSIKGAQAWNDTRSAEILGAYSGQAVAVPGDPVGKAYATAKPDARGDVDAAYSTVVGDIVLNVAYSSPKQLAAGDLRNWARTELASLRTAPAPKADAPDPAAGTEQVACDTLRSCLPATPRGDEAWTSPNNSDWVKSSTLTPQQFATLLWLPANRDDALTNFGTYDVTGIAHTDWMNGDGDEQADVYLAQTLTESGASTIYGDNFGEPNWDAGVEGVSYAVPGESDAQAWYTNKPDSHGFIHFYLTDQIGNVDVNTWFYFYGSLDKSVANTWARNILARVKASTHTQALGLSSLAAPTVKVPAQGSCPTSGDCLMALPAGASDTTSKSMWETSKTVSTSSYAVEFDAQHGLFYGDWLAADGMKSAEHREWTARSGATAVEALLKFGTAAQARASALLEYGLSAQSQRVCTVAAISDALCLAEPVAVEDFYQMETVQVLAWKGDYEVRVNVTVSHAADLAEAYAWAEQQLALLPAS